MSEQHSIKRIENHTARFIFLPATPGHPRGIKLIPGLNTVPVSYLTELEEVVLVTEASVDSLTRRSIPAQTERPAAKMFAQLFEPVRIVTANGEAFGPQITVYEDVMSDRQDGVPPPQTLPQKKELAKILIDATTERAALERWSKQGRGEIAGMAQARLRLLTESGYNDETARNEKVYRG